MADFAIPSINDSDLTTCPHCGAQTRLIADDRFRWVCGACSGARVPSPDERAHSAAEKEHLQRAKQLIAQAHAARGFGALTGLSGTFAAFLATIFLFGIHVGVALPLVLLMGAAALFVMTLAFGRSARAKVDEAKTSVTAAWELVAEALLRMNNHALTAAELAAMMKTTEPDAERLLTLLSVDDKVRSVVTEDAQIRYSIPGQMRVQDPRSHAPTMLSSAAAISPPASLSPRASTTFSPATAAPASLSPKASTVLAGKIEEEDIASAHTVLAEKITENK